MSFIGGYQSNINLNELNFVGDFPIEHSLGGFGIGLGQNDYAITLNTSFTQYRQGMLVQVAFAETNTGPARVNVNNRGMRLLRKPMGAGLQDLNAGEINPSTIYLLVYDGQGFQVANATTGGSVGPVPDASESQKGIAQIATSQELVAGIDNAKIVTPAKLAAYIAANLVAASELIAGYVRLATLSEVSAGTNDSIAISPRQLKEYLNTLSGTEAFSGFLRLATQPEVSDGISNSTTISPLRLKEYLDTLLGTEAISGFLRLATLPEVSAGISNSTAVSPRRLKEYLDTLLGTETVGGFLRLATQLEVSAGLSTSIAVSPRRLKDHLDTLQATETISGLLKLASQPEVNDGMADNKAVSPLKLHAFLNTLLRFQNGSGPSSIIPRSGANNLATGNFAAILSGQNNEAAGAYSTANGQYALATMPNEWAKAGGSFIGIKGSAQCSILNLMGVIPLGNGRVPVSPDGNSSANGGWMVPDNGIHQFRLQLTITQTDGTVGTTGSTWTGIYEGTVRNQHGITDWVGTAPTVQNIRQDPGFSPVSGFFFNPGEIVLYVERMLEQLLFANAIVYINQTKFSF